MAMDSQDRLATPPLTLAPAVTSRLGSWLAYGIFVGALVFFLNTAHHGWRSSLVEDQGFRQTQTAISAYYTVKQGPKLAYETPVVGPPWAVPYEFPLYQWLVAAAVAELGTPLDQTGRFVSVAFFLLTLIPANHLLAQMRFSRESRLVILSLFLTSPFYLYWSRAFLIESTALFFSMVYLALSASFLRAPMLTLGCGAVATGMLAGAVKATTFAPCFVGVALFAWYLLVVRFREDRSWRTAGQLLGRLLFLAVPPLVAVAAWTQFTDVTKEHNYIGHFITTRALRSWNFGTLAGRCSVAQWSMILGHLRLVVGRFVCVGLCLPGIWFRGWRRQIGVSLILAMSAPMLFQNLYFHHEYYAYANGIFVLAAMGMGLGVLIERGRWCRGLAYAGLAAFAVIGIGRYYEYFYPKQKNRGTERWLSSLVQAIQEETRPDDTLVVLGCDWSSEIPYYSQRRALMIPNWRQADFMQNPKAYLEALNGYRIGALVVFDPPPRHLGLETIQPVIAAANLEPACRYATSGIFAVYPAKAPKQWTPPLTEVSSPTARAEEK
jgi:hypothetical protein